MRVRDAVGVVVVVGLVLVAGCGNLLGGTGGVATETVTPAPVPESTPTPVATPTPTTAPDTTVGPAGENGQVRRMPGMNQPRYFSLRPTCERPPGLVIHIQVAALGNNDRATNEGINTTWQFAAPSNREVVGPYPNFVTIILRGYDPLLNASTVTYGPLERDGDVATQRVSVTAGDENETTTYTWRVEKQTEEPYVGCWMTTSVIRE